MAWLFDLWWQLSLWFLGFAILFGLLSVFMPCNQDAGFFRHPRALMTDVLYWFLGPVILRFVRVGLLTLGVAFILQLDAERLGLFLKEGYGPLAAMPLWLQCLLILFLSDVYLYWVHRLFHRNHFWRYHAIHHSPKDLQWTAAARFHPVNLIAGFMLAEVALMLMGFSPLAFVILAPFNTFYSAMVHANLNWTFGPFKAILASPVFHRWHHTHSDQGGNMNFAPTFSFLDVWFGTYYMPEDRLPEIYGTDDDDVPEEFFAQLIYPWLLSKPPANEEVGS